MIAVTFDIDDVAWTSRQPCDEFAEAVPAIVDILEGQTTVISTWFIRIDAGIELQRGNPEALFERNAPVIERLRAGGHEIAWHHHSVVAGTANQPSEDVSRACSEIRRLAPRVLARGITSVRLGWAHSHRDIVACLDELGFTVDSTALPRPSYPWDAVSRDWSGTSAEPYYPSIEDHRVSGTSGGSILEVPISVAPLSLPNDTQPGVMRYLNLAYHPQLFGAALECLESLSVIVTVTHPYETIPTEVEHPLLAFSIDALRQNLSTLAELRRPFVTMRELVN